MVMDDRDLRDRSLENLRSTLEMVRLERSGWNYGVEDKHPLVELSYCLNTRTLSHLWHLDDEYKGSNANRNLLLEAERARRHLNDSNPLAEVRLSLQNILATRMLFGYPGHPKIPEKGNFIEAYQKSPPAADIVGLVLRVGIHPKYGSGSCHFDISDQMHALDAWAGEFIHRVPFWPIAIFADYNFPGKEKDVQERLKAQGYELLPRNTPPQ